MHEHSVNNRVGTTLVDMLDHRESDSGRRTSSAVVFCQLDLGRIRRLRFVVPSPLALLLC